MLQLCSAAEASWLWDLIKPALHAALWSDEQVQRVLKPTFRIPLHRFDNFGLIFRQFSQVKCQVIEQSLIALMTCGMSDIIALSLEHDLTEVEELHEATMKESEQDVAQSLRGQSGRRSGVYEEEPLDELVL